MLLNVAGQLLLKASTIAVGYFDYSCESIMSVGWKLATDWHFISAMCCYMFGVVIWILALSRVQVSIAYPLLSLGYVVNAVAARYLFNESLNTAKVIGMGVMIFGVVIISHT